MTVEIPDTSPGADEIQAAIGWALQAVATSTALTDCHQAKISSNSVRLAVTRRPREFFALVILLAFGLVSLVVEVWLRIEWQVLIQGLVVFLLTAALTVWARQRPGQAPTLPEPTASVVVDSTAAIQAVSDSVAIVDDLHQSLTRTFQRFLTKRPDALPDDVLAFVQDVLGDHLNGLSRDRSHELVHVLKVHGINVMSDPADAPSEAFEVRPALPGTPEAVDKPALIRRSDTSLVRRGVVFRSL